MVRRRTIGGVVALGSVVGLLLLAANLDHPLLLAFDRTLFNRFEGWREPGVLAFFAIVTWGGSLYMLGPLSLATLALLAYRKAFSAGARFALTFGGATTTTYAIKALLVRERPPLLESAMMLGPAFPSGHTTQAVAFALALIAARDRSFSLGAVQAALLILLAGAVALSRLYLQVHWGTDVVGGLLVALLWAGLAWMSPRPWEEAPGAGLKNGA